MFKGNKVYKVDKFGNKKRYYGVIPGLAIRFKGSNSVVEIHEPISKFSGCRIRIKDNTRVVIGSSPYQIKKLSILGESEQEFIIGDDFYTYGCELIAASEKGLKITVGKGCMFARGVVLRASDGHSIKDKTSGKVLNFGKNICIKDNVWLAGNVAVLKGVTIGSNSLVGYGSVVTRDCAEYSAYAGVPAGLIKSNIVWDREAPRKDFKL